MSCIADFGMELEDAIDDDEIFRYLGFDCGERVLLRREQLRKERIGCEVSSVCFV